MANPNQNDALRRKFRCPACEKMVVVIPEGRQAEMRAWALERVSCPRCRHASPAMSWWGPIRRDESAEIREILRRKSPGQGSAPQVPRPSAGNGLITGVAALGAFSCTMWIAVPVAIVVVVVVMLILSL